MKLRVFSKFAMLASSVVLGFYVGFASKDFRAHAAQGQTTDDTQRCATRISAAVIGKAPSSALLSSPNPQADVDGLLLTPEFITRFSGFINATFNREPGASPAEDAPYYLAKYVLEKNLPWKELFVGGYSVVEDSNKQAVVNVDANGVGYFRSPAWVKRYAGNEPAGYKLPTAYRFLNNTIGMKLVASTNAPDVDITTTGRQASPCKSCHFDPWYALDKIAKVLTRRSGTGDKMTFNAPPAADVPQQLIDGISISNDKDVITALVNSEAFRFRQCRLAFMYLYGRSENKNEGGIFDKCMAEFTAKGTIQSAIAAIAKDASFCQ